jgi:hypothetical protein
MSSRPRPQLPMWARWVLASVVGIAVIAGIVIAIHRAGPEGPTSEAGAEAEVNRVSDIAISEDQAPHTASLSVRTAPVASLERAIAADVHQRIAHDQLTGPLQALSCARSGKPSAGRAPYRCTVHSAGISYPFLAVVDEQARRLTWCKVDPPPVAEAGPEIPVSDSCKV